MAAPSAETTRMSWGVGLAWARSYPAWEGALRAFLRDARSIGLTVIDLRNITDHGVEIVATRPGDPHRHEDWI